MRRLFQLVIELYWKVVPASRRRRCIFQESCSRYVWRMLEEGGCRAGIVAFRCRWRQCRPGYQIVSTSVGIFVHLSDGSVIPEADSRLRLPVSALDSA